MDLTVQITDADDAEANYGGGDVEEEWKLLTQYLGIPPLLDMLEGDDDIFSLTLLWCAQLHREHLQVSSSHAQRAVGI